MPNKIAEKTISLIRKALGGEDSASDSIGVIQLIQELASRSFSISVSELSELIERDRSITGKVLNAANTFGFNPSGTPISTISEAIQIVGFEKIRNLSLSILLVENCGQQLNEEEQREMASVSISSGLMAQQLLERFSISVDPDLAFICSMLRNYGKLLMTHFLIEEYREAKVLADELGDDAAFKQVFGLTPLELGQSLLLSDKLPEAIKQSLSDMPSEAIDEAKSTKTPSEQMLSLAELCARVCETTFDPDIKPEEFDASLSSIAQRFEPRFHVDLDIIKMSMSLLDANLSLLGKAIDKGKVAKSISGKLTARMTGKPLPPRLSQARARPVNDHAGGPSSESNAPRNNLSQACGAAVLDLRDALNLENSIIFVSEDYDSTRFSARYGFGPLFRKIRNRPMISEKNQDVFSICIKRKGDILIQDAKTGKIMSVMPDWMKDSGNTQSFILLPVLRQGELFAIIFGSTSLGNKIEPSEEDLLKIRDIREELICMREGALAAS